MSPTLAPLQLRLMGLCHRKLGVVEGIAGVILNVLVDCQHFRGQRFRCRVKERYEQLLDPLRHGNAEGIDVFRDRACFVQRVYADGRIPEWRSAPLLSPSSMTATMFLSFSHSAEATPPAYGTGT